MCLRATLARTEAKASTVAEKSATSDTKHSLWQLMHLRLPECVRFLHLTGAFADRRCARCTSVRQPAAWIVTTRTTLSSDAFESAGEIDFCKAKGSGYVAHPAVTDNTIQLGPISGSLDGPSTAPVTRYMPCFFDKVSVQLCASAVDCP